MKRAAGWEQRLRELVDAHRFRPFVYGSNDCATFAMADYRALMGEDAPNAPTWSDPKEALRLVRDNGLEAMTTAAIGKPVDGWMNARRGDIVLIPANIDDCKFGLTVCVGSLLASPGLNAIAFTPLKNGLKTWRIGD